MTLFSEAFADVVKEYRHAAGLSKAALAEKANLHQTYIGLLENGDRSPSVDTANAIAEALGVSFSSLVKATEKKMAESKEQLSKEVRLKVLSRKPGNEGFKD